jgi:hypothetical protein
MKISLEMIKYLRYAEFAPLTLTVTESHSPTTLDLLLFINHSHKNQYPNSSFC